MRDIRKPGEGCVAAFDGEDRDRIAGMLCADCMLSDPAGRFSGRPNVLEYIRGIFRGPAELHFSARNIFVDGSGSVIEFDLALNPKRFVGVDRIEWRGARMRELRAFLQELKD